MISARVQHQECVGLSDKVVSVAGIGITLGPGVLLSSQMKGLALVRGRLRGSVLIFGTCLRGCIRDSEQDAEVKEEQNGCGANSHSQSINQEQRRLLGGWNLGRRIHRSAKPRPGSRDGSSWGG